MAWIYLLIAAVFEVVFALATNATEGFTQLGPSLLTAAAAAVGIFFLSLALKTLDVGVGYTIWTGIGSVGTVVLGAVIFGEEFTIWKVLAFVLIIGGVLGLKLSDRLTADKPSAA
ncbi:MULTISPECIES: DMT family transporter [Streptosporangium]|uniref:Small multidrug resistance protein n=1 Tax=Streptosporangium roseum (strain ATCC 12428 / DSM 43021 / JCM 3005 / KCTC 9067 / NCIMB 10171 / NRRL 2505 / NI 9100) TaxID=479432 RepID=D2AX85_STRRD|nr:multidrug efflux SMR transporter [Streptosporangium roseum]ACZ90812.1 small multidrug resistance protein [Streptosporangium roseum DSM 43021]